MFFKNYLIFDFGASNGRVVVAKFNGKRFDMDVIHRFNNRPVYAAGILYWDILRLYLELKTGILLSLKKYSDITSMGIATWGTDFGFIDKKGNLISNPVHYRDKKRNSMTDSLYEIIPKVELFNLTGGVLLSIVSIFHIYSLKLQNATELLNANKFLMIPDIFNYFLTGKVCNEFTNATTTLMYNQKEKKWEDKIIDKIGISKDIFGEIIMPGNKIDSIQKSVCRELEINPISVIAPATHDTASAIAGIPAVDKNCALISIGTWGVVAYETSGPLINSEVLKAGYANIAGVEGLNILFKNLTGLWIIQQCRAKWIKDKNVGISWDQIIRMSFKAKPFKSFIDVDDPLFAQAQIDMPVMIRKYCRNKGQSVPEDIGEISRCIYESLVMKFRYNIETLEELINKKIELLYIVGGGAKNELLCQWTADATDLPVFSGQTETASVGNLLMQLKAAGEIKTLEEGRQISLDSYKVMSYKPEEKSIWDDFYNKYLEILNEARER